MKILITGAAGYIGSVLVPKLLALNHEVIALDNLMYGQSSLLDCCHYKTLTFVRGDTRDEALVTRLVREVDAILPLACLTGAPLCDKDPVAAKTVIVDGIKIILKAKSPQQKIVIPTTNSGYGIGEKHAYCTEESPLRPVSLYGRLKVDAEKAVLDAGGGISIRLATAFGVSPRMRLDLLVNDFVYRAVNDRFLVLFEAHAKRNYIHVRDICKAFVHCLEKFEAMKNQAYNVGLSDANLSKLELCEEIKKVVPSFYFTEAAIGEDPDKRDYIVSNAKIESTGYRPDVSLRDGLVELVKAYQIIKRSQYANV
jgi:nucleoside-diphosphate-sugar epimerase